MRENKTIRGEIDRWLEAFADCVRSRDFARARGLFARDTHGFGTVERSMESLARLERAQWARVWPRTSGFCFLRTGMRVAVSGDGGQAVVMARWKACNDPAPARPVYDRRGRATVLLRRTGAARGWVAQHTHFSFDPQSVAKRAGAA
jgi:ketosteroid isomerase-like protein